MGRFLRSVSTDTVDPRQYKNYQEYTSAGSYSFTVPAGVSRIRAIVVGAGGGGACSKTTYYGGNGGGGVLGIITAKLHDDKQRLIKVWIEQWVP